MKPILPLLLCAALLAEPSAAPAAPSKPNIIIFLVDDMGWMDSGAYGSQYYKTPHMDAFAKQAMRFTDAYSQPLCSPTRASILSGQYTSRHGVTSAAGHTAPVKAALQEKASANAPFLMPESGSYLDPAQYTLAEALRDAGYKTAHIGKWHLGLTEPHWPEAQGFETTFHCHPDPGPPGGYFSPYGVLPPGSERPKDKSVKYVVGNISDGPEGEYIVDRQAAEAEKFLEANKDRPFFLNLWCYGVHGPWGHKEAYTAEFAKTTDPRGQQGNPIMASMLRSVDECFGRILAKLDEQGLAENTIVIFTSDNGGNKHSNTSEDGKTNKRKSDDPKLLDWRKWAGDKPPTNNAPLRDGKGRMYEGGTRVPLMVRWPGKIAPAATSDAIVGCIDIYPTVLDLLGMPLPKQQKIDGVSYAPVLRGTGPLKRDAYFIWFPHLVPGVSVRQGDWKLIRRFTERPEDFEGLHELFNLKEDLGETTNLASKNPEKVKELDALIDRFIKETGAIYPQPNPAYKPKPAAPGGSAAAPADPLDGLLPRQCDARVEGGALKITGKGAKPYLGTGKVKHSGPMKMELRARAPAGGAGRLEWRLDGQEEVPEGGQTAGFTLPPDGSWHDLSVPLSVKGRTAVVRLFLPPGAVEIESLRFVGADSGKTVYAWNFGAGK